MAKDLYFANQNLSEETVLIDLLLLMKFPQVNCTIQSHLAYFLNYIFLLLIS
jgi:hypothetical protein